MTRSLAFYVSSRRRFVGAALALAVLAVSATAQAAPVTPTQFATFSQTPGTPVQWINTGIQAPGLGGLLFTASGQVNFNFLLPGAPSGPIAANLQITATSTQPATSASGSTPFGPITVIDQGINVSSSVIRITDTTPAHHNLLTLFFTGDITGLQGGSSAQLHGDSIASPTTTVSYSSDYLNFGSQGGTYVVNLSGLTNTAGGTGLQISSINQFLESFVAGAMGSFAAINVSPVTVPAPASIALLGTSMLLTPTGLFLARRQRRPKTTSS